jgi:hypothetical protein
MGADESKDAGAPAKDSVRKIIFGAKSFAPRDVSGPAGRDAEGLGEPADRRDP